MSMLSDYQRCVEKPRVEAMESTIAALRERITELEALLEPFATMAGSFPDERPAHVVLSKAGAIIQVGDLRRAEVAIKKA